MSTQAAYLEVSLNVSHTYGAVAGDEDMEGKMLSVSLNWRHVTAAYPAQGVHGISNTGTTSPHRRALRIGFFHGRDRLDVGEIKGWCQKAGKNEHLLVCSRLLQKR